MRELNFRVDGGCSVRNGKPEWPDCLTVEMSQAEALELIARLANAVRNGEPDEPVTVTWMGQAANA